jgi:hypothetical protein
MSRIDRLTPEAMAAVEADLELIQQQLVSVLRRISGHVPARTIDLALRVDQALHRFCVNCLDQPTRRP